MVGFSAVNDACFLVTIGGLDAPACQVELTLKWWNYCGW